MGTFKGTSRLPKFERDITKLLKKFKTIGDDLEIFIEKQLFLYHKLKVDNKGIFQITGLPVENPKVYKAKKFACKSLKGRGVQSGIRVIYAYDEKKDIIMLIEIYFKGDKANEDKERILEYLR
jgi:mRNA-degrading endonuclease RelE of RelBE toxin-antitoxin system